MRMLFIEDDVSRNKPFVNFIKGAKTDWEIIWEKSPQDAIEKLKDEINGPGLDIILLDIMLPVDETVKDKKTDMGMSTGIVLIEIISEITKSEIPIIVLSARQDLGYLEEDGRVRAYIRKPKSAKEVIDEIEEILYEK